VQRANFANALKGVASCEVSEGDKLAIDLLEIARHDPTAPGEPCGVVRVRAELATDRRDT
jgi:hypothetical protein